MAAAVVVVVIVVGVVVPNGLVCGLWVKHAFSTKNIITVFRNAIFLNNPCSRKPTGNRNQ